MLETVREFGLECLAANNESDVVRLAHAGHFLALAERAAPEWWGAEPAVWLDRLEADHNNLRSAGGWAIDRTHAELGCRLAIALHWLWRIRGPVDEGRRWTEALLAGNEEVAPALRAALLARAGDLAMVQGAIARAAELLDASIALARELGERQILASALGWRGVTAHIEGRYDLDEHLHEEAVLLAGEIGMPFWRARWLNSLAAVARRQGNDARATVLLEEAHAVAQAGGFVWTDILNRGMLGDIAADHGDLARAETLYRESLELAGAIGDRRSSASALAGFARIVAAGGDFERSARLCGLVDALHEIIGVRLTVTGQTSHEEAVAAAQAGLGDVAFAAARTAGRTLTPQDVLSEIDHQSILAAEAQDSARANRWTIMGLTPREVEVLRLICVGLSNREIGDRLYISERTAQTHVQNILGKLTVGTRAAAAAVAVEHGLR